MMTTQQTQLANAAGEYRVAPSWQLATILAFGHVGVAVIVLLLDISVAWQLSILVVLVASLVFELRTTALRLSQNSFVEIRISPDNVFSARTRASIWTECDVLGSTYVTSGLTILMLRPRDSNRARSLVLLPDSMDTDDFRRLRMWLRWRPESI